MSANRSSRRFIAALAAAALCGSLPAPALGDTWVAPRAQEESNIADLEKAFWFCDYVATTEGVQATPVAACRFATEQLKKEKFAGNFDEFLAWWRRNKPAEHLKLHELKRSEAVL